MLCSYTMQSEGGLPSCVEVGQAAFELVLSQNHRASSAGYGNAGILLLARIFIIDKQLNTVWEWKIIF